MRRLLLALMIAFGALGPSAAQAGGLLQDLFAPAAPPPPVVYHYAPPPPQMRFVYDEGFRVSRPRRHAQRKVAPRHAVDQRLQARRASARPLLRAHRRAQAAPHRQAAKINRRHVVGGIVHMTTNPPPHASRAAAIVEPHAIQDDPTLRPGDAYMTPQGLRIYRGRSANRTAFVDWRRANLSRPAEKRIALLDRTSVRSDYASFVTRTAGAHGGRRHDGGSARTAVDRRGRVIRVVGP